MSVSGRLQYDRVDWKWKCTEIKSIVGKQRSEENSSNQGKVNKFIKRLLEGPRPMQQHSIL